MAENNPLVIALKEAALGLIRSDANRMMENEAFWEAPLFGVAQGADPLWQDFKEKAVGSGHWTPKEAFSLAYPEADVSPEELSVLVWVLPQTQATKEESAREKLYPGERWMRSRWFGESAVNAPLCQLMLSELQARGVQAVAPDRLADFGQITSDFGRASKWSHRHAAYAAGLGTFGLSDGLITKAGKAHRLGSVVLRANLEPTVRPYTSHREYCLFFKDGSCAACAGRCPAGSVNTKGRDKELCYNHLMSVTMPYAEKTWGWSKYYGCGQCQTAVPCQSGIPV
ncbi:MAG: epoxyqueuosine reductase [Spirochaetes bacterium]|nr:epoxyqueuosine reductase [Spirochaetota bacterium]